MTKISSWWNSDLACKLPGCSVFIATVVSRRKPLYTDPYHTHHGQAWEKRWSLASLKSCIACLSSATELAAQCYIRDQISLLSPITQLPSLFCCIILLKAATIRDRLRENWAAICSLPNYLPVPRFPFMLYGVLRWAYPADSSVVHLLFLFLKCFLNFFPSFHFLRV